MKKILTVLLLIIGWVAFAGMSKAPESEIPKPEIDFAATVIDDQEIPTKCRLVSWEGQLFFVGFRGKGAVSIPFEKVKKVVFIGAGSGGKKDAQITLRGGEVVAVTFDDESRFYGTTTFGTYKITAKNIKEIIFE
ncbi:MAG: hypothetical protein HZB54_05750 [Deltaproteobacteria bacterium]|nr:hypothetical protein [Deltaproteobacteria bacterium]